LSIRRLFPILFRRSVLKSLAAKDSPRQISFYFNENVRRRKNDSTRDAKFSGKGARFPRTFAAIRHNRPKRAVVEQLEKFQSARPLTETTQNRDNLRYGSISIQAPTLTETT
jgi:hypothetical protein